MPRETVYTSTRTTVPEPTSLITGAVDRDRPVQLVVDVGWANDASHVQLGVAAVDPDTNERVAVGWFADLDWASCNRLVKLLRTARDRSFGRAE